jgi:hypothetical protein
MTKDEALKLALDALKWANKEINRWLDDRGLEPEDHPEIMQAITAIKEALAQSEERNFCPRCGKRTADLTTIHTCTPPRENI